MKSSQIREMWHDQLNKLTANKLLIYTWSWLIILIQTSKSQYRYAIIQTHFPQSTTPISYTILNEQLPDRSSPMPIMDVDNWTDMHYTLFPKVRTAKFCILTLYYKYDQYGGMSYWNCIQLLDITCAYKSDNGLYLQTE